MKRFRQLVYKLGNRFSREKSESTSSAAQQVAGEDNNTQAKVPRKDAPTPTKDADAPSSSPTREELPELPTGNLNHTAALHRISVRPKNRRPPRRTTSQTSDSGSATPTTPTANGLPRIDSISENSLDTMDSLEGVTAATSNDNLSIGSSNNNSNASSSGRLESPQETAKESPATTKEATKPIPILRKSSSRLSRNSDVFEELEAKLPVLRKPAVSPDSLESNLDARSHNDAGVDVGDEVAKLSSPNLPKPSPRSASTSSDGYERSPRRRSSSNRLSKSPDSLESNSPGWLTKSSEGFDKLSDFEREAATASPLAGKPVPAARRLLLQPSMSKSQERVCGYSKSSDSLEALEASLLNSDDSMERRRSSFEIRPRRGGNQRAMSKSTECFEEHHQQQVAKIELEKPKRASVSEINLSRGGRYGKMAAKSSESFEKIAQLEVATSGVWRGNNGRRVAHSSESSDNLDLDDNCKLENRNKARRSIPKRLSGCGFIDEQENVVLRKPVLTSRMQKSSESSELGSTDTLDSERRNTIKSSDSDETLDSLEKDLQEQSQTEQDRKDEETTESVVERREKEEEQQQPIWRRRTNSHEPKLEKETNNLDIHQLLAYTLVSKVQENGNNDVVQANNDDNHDHAVVVDERPKSMPSPGVVYPKKKLHQQQMQQQQQQQQLQQQHQQSSSDDNQKTLNDSTINNLLSTKTDEDLQNMLNGNISEVSTDTKSFREKLIMFEKLGK